jgi:hypothetical protein
VSRAWTQAVVRQGPEAVVFHGLDVNRQRFLVVDSVDVIVTVVDRMKRRRDQGSANESNESGSASDASRSQQKDGSDVRLHWVRRRPHSGAVASNVGCLRSGRILRRTELEK